MGGYACRITRRRLCTPLSFALRAHALGIYRTRSRREEARPGDSADGSKRYAVLEGYVAEVDELENRPDLRGGAGSAEGSSQGRQRRRLTCQFTRRIGR